MNLLVGIPTAGNPAQCELIARHALRTNADERYPYAQLDYIVED